MNKRPLYTLLFTLALLTTNSVKASPSYLTESELSCGNYTFVEKIEITGDINASPSQLVYGSLKNKMSDYYVIQDMNENTLNNTLTITVSLYRQPLLDINPIYLTMNNSEGGLS